MAVPVPYVLSSNNYVFPDYPIPLMECALAQFALGYWLHKCGVSGGLRRLIAQKLRQLCTMGKAYPRIFMHWRFKRAPAFPMLELRHHA